MPQKSLILLSLMLIISQVIPISLSAQAPCGTQMPTEMMSWLAKYKQQNPVPQKRSSDNILYLPATIHLVANDGGFGRFSDEKAYRMVCISNNQMLQTGIQIYIKPYHQEQIFNYIDNTEYYDHTYSSGRQMMKTYNVANSINIYVVSNPSDYCGYFSPPEDAIAVAQKCANDGDATTLTHELGHYFALPHTFNGWEESILMEPSNKRSGSDNIYYGNGTRHYKERVTRVGSEANCNIAGDFFCDTPADYTYVRWACSTKTLHDPLDRVLYPDPAYYMSYSSDVCKTLFSPEQIDVMLTYAKHYRTNLIDSSYIKSTNILSHAYPVMPALHGTTINSNNVTLAWTKVEETENYLLEVKKLQGTDVLYSGYVADTFLTLENLAANQRYRWAISPSVASDYCSSNSKVSYFTTTNEGELSISQLQMITPKCPDEQLGQITVEITGGTKPYVYTWTSPDDHIDEFKSENNTANNLVSGSYYLKVEDATGASDVFNFQMPTIPSINTHLIQTGLSKAYLEEITGGQAPYELLWEDGQTGREVIGLAPGKHMVTITDANNCMVIDTVSVYDIQVDIEQISCYAARDGSIRLTINETETNEDTYNISWQHTNSTIDHLMDLDIGTYRLTITKNAQTIAKYTFLLEETAPLDGTASPHPIHGMIAYTKGGMPPYSYLWPTFTDFQENLDTIANIPNGNHLLYVKDARGCLDTIAFEYRSSIVANPEEELFDTGIRLYPTILDHHMPLRLELASLPTQDGQVQIFGSTGQLIYQENLVKGRQSYDLVVDWTSGSGVYLVKIVVGNQLWIRKLFVQ